MKILYITDGTEDYLSDSLLHGLKNIYGCNVVDYPAKEILYQDCPIKIRSRIRGKGFTLYFLLSPSLRNSVINSVVEEITQFDYVIFSSINRQFKIYLQLYNYLNKDQAIIIDGEDNPAIVPYFGYYWRRPKYWFIPRPHKKFIYFKREWTPDTKRYRYYKYLPNLIVNFLPELKNLRQISFSIPEEKIIKQLPEKTKLFPKHIVDEEVAGKVDGSTANYAFEKEADYYLDLQKAKFGITTKRSGWDCLRHYEIAANGTVICFKDLDKKPVTCAPHGLIPGLNCISYKNYDDLIAQISNINDERYKKLQMKGLDWINNNTTMNSAKRLIRKFNLLSK